MGKFFAWELFVVIEHLWYYAIESQRIYSPGGCHEIAFLNSGKPAYVWYANYPHYNVTLHNDFPPKKLQDLAISFIEIVKPCMCVRSTCYKYILYVDRFESVIYKSYNLNSKAFMQFDVIVRRICAFDILEYLKKETSQDNLTKFFTIVILNFLYSSIINLMKRDASHPGMF